MKFCLGDILSITTKKMYSPTGMEGVNNLLQYLLEIPQGSSLMSQYKFMAECQDCLYSQVPNLKGMTDLLMTQNVEMLDELPIDLSKEFRILNIRENRLKNS